MFKFGDTSKSFNNSQCGRKCAEVFYQNLDNFSIVCVTCEMKTFDFNDFLLHFNNVHHISTDASIKSDDNIPSDSKESCGIKNERKVADAEEEENDNFDYDEKFAPIIQMAGSDKFEFISEKSSPVRRAEADDAWSPTSSEDSDEDFRPGKTMKLTEKKEQTETTLSCTHCNKNYKLQKCLEHHIEKCHSGKPSTTPRINKCNNCEEQFRKKSDLDVHIYKVHGGFRCDQCDRLYKNREDLQLHQLNHTGERNYICDLGNCGKAFFNRKYLSRHKRLVHAKEKSFCCDTCGYSTRIKASLERHKQIHTAEKESNTQVQKCTICDLEFVGKCEIDAHNCEVHGFFRCDQCDKVYKKREDLQLHYLNHSGERSYICDFDNCEKSFFNRKYLARHKRLVHNKGKKYCCETCGYTTESKLSLDRHQRSHNGENTGTNAHNYKCTNCEREFVNKRDLDVHIYEAHGGFRCDQCDRVYKNREDLQLHQLNHSGERNYICDIDNCRKAFFNRKYLTRHKRLVHTNELNYCCEYCGYRTRVKADLIRHKRTHTGEKPYACETCGKCFATRSLVANHRASHSQERPFKCEVCGAAFARAKTLAQHKFLHLAVKQFVCKLCGKAFAQSSSLAGHMRQHKAQWNV